MANNHLNSTRAGRSIDNLDRSKNTAIDPGSGDPHGRRMPQYKHDAVVAQAAGALDHVQVSGIGDIAETGKEIPTGTAKKPAGKSRR